MAGTYGTPGVTYGGTGTYGSWGTVQEPSGGGGKVTYRPAAHHLTAVRIQEADDTWAIDCTTRPPVTGQADLELLIQLDLV